MCTLAEKYSAACNMLDEVAADKALCIAVATENDIDESTIA